MDGTHAIQTPGKSKYAHFTYEKSCRVSPVAKKSPSFSGSPGVCETPVRERRLSRISENEAYSPGTRPPTSGETLANLPIHTTPPSRLKDFKVQNPFDASFRRNFHLPFISPTLFTKTASPLKVAENFSWSIEDLANLFPADIDEFQVQTDQPCDNQTEQEVQSSISRFFESNNIVPSPWGTIESCRPIPFSDVDCTPVKPASTDEKYTTKLIDIEEKDELIITSVSKKEVWTQTQLTFPGEYPSPLDSFGEKTVPDIFEKNGSFTHLEHFPPLRSEPICSSPCFYPYRNLLSSTIQTPKNKILTRSFGTPLGCSSLMSPIGLSPIVHTFQQVSMHFNGPRESMESLCCSCNKHCDISDSGVASTMSQTDLAFPNHLPKFIEEVLKPYETFVQDQTEAEEVAEDMNLNSSLSRRRKLLFHESLDMSVSSIDNGYDSS